MTFIPEFLYCRSTIPGITPLAEPNYICSLSHAAAIAVLGGLLDCIEHILTYRQALPFAFPTIAFLGMLVRILNTHYRQGKNLL